MNFKFFIDRLKDFFILQDETSNQVYLQGKDMSKKYHVKERMFLNEELDMPAFIIAIVEDTSEEQKKDDFYYGEMTLTLSDCYRQVSYDFSLSGEESRKAALYKIRRIAKMVNAFHDALEKEAELIDSIQNPKTKTAKA